MYGRAPFDWLRRHTLPACVERCTAQQSEGTPAFTASAPALNDLRFGLLARVRRQLREVLRICHWFFDVDNQVSNFIDSGSRDSGGAQRHIVPPSLHRAVG
jgi:hypothetical protein